MQDQRTDHEDDAVPRGKEGQTGAALRTPIQPALDRLLGDVTRLVMPVVVVGEGSWTGAHANLLVGEGDLKVGEFGEGATGEEEGATCSLTYAPQGYDSRWTACEIAVCSPERIR